MLARQLLAEERVGRRAREALAEEDNMIARSFAGIRRGPG